MFNCCRYRNLSDWLTQSVKEIPATSILFKELSVLGSFRFGPVYTNVLDACESGCVKAEDVVSKTFAFEDLPQALQYACEGDEVMKVQVEM